MKKILSLIIIYVCVLTGNAAPIVERADSAYSADNFPLAIQLYQEALQKEGASTELYYNLGNAYYRDMQLGQAIIAYERALKIDPSNSDARTNLEFVNGKIADKPVDNDSLTEKLADKIINYTTADVWSWIALGLFCIFLAGVAGYIFTSSIPVRKICFFGGMVIFVLFLASLIVSINAASRSVSTDKAIVTSEAVHLGTSPRTPREKSEQAFLLHEGTKIAIVDSLTVTTDSLSTKWYEVKVDNEHRAWINSKDIEKI